MRKYILSTTNITYDGIMQCIPGTTSITSSDRHSKLLTIRLGNDTIVKAEHEIREAVTVSKKACLLCDQHLIVI